MSTADKFTFSRDFSGIDPSALFEGILAWLKAEGATIERTQKPSQIEALHGNMTAVSVWKKDVEKSMSFRLTEANDSVHVELTMAPVSSAFGYDVYTYQKKIQSNWGQLAEELWKKLDGLKQA